MEEKQVASYEFGPYRLLLSERLLLRDGKPVPLTPRVFDTLLVFVQNNGRLLTKDELMKLIWGDRFVEEGNLTQNIFILRKTLGESAQDHQYLVTIPLQGYRFVAKVKEHRDEDAPSHTAEMSPSKSRAAGARVTSIAVLPFTILNDPAGENFVGIGISDTLITKLSNLKRLVVRPTTAILRYASDKQDLPAVGRELQVEAVLDGTIQHLEERIRVNVRLVNVSDGVTLWADKFDDQFTDIFAVQDSIAKYVAQALEVELSGEEQRQLSKSYTDNIETYQLYVKGRYFWNTRTEKGLLKSIDYAQQVIRLEPGNALAYLGLADSYTLLGQYLYLHPQAAFPKAKTATVKALEIDPTLAETYASLAEVAFFYEWDWAAAERYYRRAAEMNPNYASGRHWYAWFLLSMGRFEEATEKIKEAQKLDPASLTINTSLGLPFFYQRRYERAIEQYRETLEMDASFMQARYYLASALTQLGLYEEAIAEYQKIIPVEYTQQASALLGYTYAVSGEREKASAVLADLKRLAGQRYVSPYLEAIIYAGLGEADHAFALLEKACQERAVWMVFLKVDPFLDRLRDDPRFVNLLRWVGFRSIE